MYSCAWSAITVWPCCNPLLPVNSSGLVRWCILKQDFSENQSEGKNMLWHPDHTWARHGSTQEGRNNYIFFIGDLIQFMSSF